MTTARSRRFLRAAGLGGLAMPLNAAMVPTSRFWGSSFAQDAGDAQIAAFAESVELAMVEAYTAAAGNGKVTGPEVVDAVATFAGHHREHAAAFGAAAGDAATGAPNPDLLEMVQDALEGAADEDAVVEVVLGLEHAAVATYLFGLGALQSPEALRLTASILPVESQHAVVLGAVLERPVSELVPGFENTDEALQTDELPTA